MRGAVVCAKTSRDSASAIARIAVRRRVIGGTSGERAENTRLTASISRMTRAPLVPTTMRVVLVCLLGSIALAQTTALPRSTEAVLARLRTDLEPVVQSEIKSARLPGLAIGVVKDGRLIYSRGFGVRKIGELSPITSRSVFHMASVTKTFVATAIMQLVERGQIDLDVSLTRYLPYFRLADERYQVITIRQMLSHTSGIPDVDDYHWDKPEFDDGALERFVRSIANKKLAFRPGSKFGYSNTAYEILGDVVAKVSGGTFEDFVQKNVLTPLGMKDSTLLLRETSPELLTSPHLLQHGRLTVSKVFPYNRSHAPSSTLYSNIEDMSRWAIANLNGGELDGKRILERETLALMWRPVIDAPTSKVGISWFTKEDHGHRFVLHAGGDVGFESLLVLAPDDSFAVIGMTNLGVDKGTPLNSYVNAAIRIVFGREAFPKKPAN
jgi:CubicO group peptidase (beta-lactamase class C family)